MRYIYRSRVGLPPKKKKINSNMYCIKQPRVHVAIDTDFLILKHKNKNCMLLYFNAPQVAGQVRRNTIIQINPHFLLEIKKHHNFYLINKNLLEAHFKAQIVLNQQNFKFLKSDQ